jgi:hypothetical protein
MILSLGSDALQGDSVKIVVAVLHGSLAFSVGGEGKHDRIEQHQC